MIDTQTVAILYMALVMFGCGYNALISWADREMFLDGYTWLAVVIGVAGTLAGVVLAFWNVELQGWQFGWISLGAFASSGAPMAIGAVGRYVTARRADQASMRAEAIYE